jgi:hypothetical protein
MTSVPDFRTLPFNLAAVDASGTSMGRSSYRKLYAIENILRVIIHSVLTVQIGPDWWMFAVDPDFREKVRGVRETYAGLLGRAPTGRHDLYFTFLPDLNKVIRPNSHLFPPAVPDIDEWMVRIERLRLPRNMVGHANWPTTAAARTIQGTHRAARTTVHDVTAAGVPLLVP